ncbi:MAG: metallophosphoesterase [Clostridia bacterium]|nr:metallophosphoesterase [Clostridia bacterium]
MKVLVIADVEERLLYDFFKKERVEGVELIISCGDLKPGYLDFLMTMVNVPMLYVLGNHDDELSKTPPAGGFSLENRVIKYKGYRIAGLGGSIKYNTRHINMYTERQMAWRCFTLTNKARLKGGIDILVTHSPVRGHGDLDDNAHRGFECFNELLNKFKPMYMFHGHVHTNYHHKVKSKLKHPSGTILINACGYQIIDLPDRE